MDSPNLHAQLELAGALAATVAVALPLLALFLSTENRY